MYYKQQNIIMIAGHFKDKPEVVKMYIETKKEQATYNFGKGIDNSYNMIYVKNKANGVVLKISEKGKITLTEKRNYLMGKFSFIGVNKENKKQITDGKFKVKIGS